MTTTMQPFMQQILAIVRDVYNNPTTRKNVCQAGDSCEFRVDTFELDCKLRTMGIKALGSGHYSVVVRTPDYTSRGTVVKIGTDPTDPWLAYAMLAMEHPDIPEFPHIMSLHLTKDFYIVEMEYLDVSPEVANRRDFEFWKGVSEFEARGMWTRFYERCPSAAHLMEDRLGVPTDFRHDNVMYRGPQVVVTDPYGHSSGQIERNRPKAPTRPYEVVSIDEQSVREQRELCTASGAVTSRVPPQGEALRKLPEFKPILDPEWGKRILSQMQRNPFLEAAELAKQVPAGRLAWPAGPQGFAVAKGREREIRGFRPDFIIMDDVGAQGELAQGAKERLRDKLVFNVEERLAPNFIHAWDGEWNKLERRVLAQAAAQRRPEPGEVPIGEFIPAVLRLPLEDRKGHLPAQHGRQQVQLRRGNR